MKETLSLKEKETIKTLYASGKTYYSISKEIRRSPHTVKKYLTSSQEVIESVQEMKQELSDMFEGLATKMISSISEEDIGKINAYQRTVSAGICTDKFRLLRNESTMNISSLSRLIIELDEQMTKDLDAEERIELERKADETE